MLGALEPLDAAAYFVVRRSEGLTRSEQDLLQDWLAADASHRKALAKAERVWRLFDEPSDDATLTAMRAQALATPRRSGWRRAMVGAVVLALAAGALLRHRRAAERTPSPH
jgi:ferric-dicitrate binding protein FerR (iron transport regulator)